MADVTPLFAAALARNRGPVPGDPDARQLPDYGVSARLAGATVEATLTFRAGSAYCCGEWGCHVDLRPGARWEWLRRGLAEIGLAAPERLELRLPVVVEAGALLLAPRRSPACPSAFAPAGADQYRVDVSEDQGWVEVSDVE